jgi:hypothetical protein
MKRRAETEFAGQIEIKKSHAPQSTTWKKCKPRIPLLGSSSVVHFFILFVETSFRNVNDKVHRFEYCTYCSPCAALPFYPPTAKHCGVLFAQTLVLVPTRFGVY